MEVQDFKNKKSSKNHRYLIHFLFLKSCSASFPYFLRNSYQARKKSTVNLRLILSHGSKCTVSSRLIFSGPGRNCAESRKKSEKITKSKVPIRSIRTGTPRHRWITERVRQSRRYVVSARGENFTVVIGTDEQVATGGPPLGRADPSVQPTGEFTGPFYRASSPVDTVRRIGSA